MQWPTRTSLARARLAVLTDQPTPTTSSEHEVDVRWPTSLEQKHPAQQQPGPHLSPPGIFGDQGHEHGHRVQHQDDCTLDKAPVEAHARLEPEKGHHAHAALVGQASGVGKAPGPARSTGMAGRVPRAPVKCRPVQLARHQCCKASYRASP